MIYKDESHQIIGKLFDEKRVVNTESKADKREKQDKDDSK